jgi:hypothetical protein
LKTPSKLRAAPGAADPQSLTRDELRRLAKAERKVASTDRVISVGGRREIQDLGRRHDERQESQSIAARLAETSSLALSRGEEVKSESVRIAVALVDEHGARIVRKGLPVYRQETVSRVRILSRGGLQLAFDRGDLDGGSAKGERLFETGKSYRWAYETSVSLNTPQRNMAPVTARAPLRASAGPQEAVFAAGEMLRIFRDGLSRREIIVLDQVCGLDQSIRATALALRADPRTIRRALLEGLTRAESNRRAAAEPRRDTESVDHREQFA